jgi:hypothetical protein
MASAIVARTASRTCAGGPVVNQTAWGIPASARMYAASACRPWAAQISACLPAFV